MSRTAHKSPGQRQLRVGEEIRHVLADIISRGGLRDPALHDRTVTVTEVRISPDLKNATAFIVPLGGDHSAEVIAGLRRCSGFLRGQIGHRLNLRYAPLISFELDQSFDRAARIDALLHSPEVQRDLLDPSDDTDA